MCDVKKLNLSNGVIEFEYKGIRIDKDTWESAICPICCKNITDDDMCCIVRTIYDSLVNEYDEQTISEYVTDLQETNFELYDTIDAFRFREEEALFLLNGGFYYE